MRWLFAILFFAVLAVTQSPTVAIARDHDKAQEAVRAGEAQPLGAIMRQVGRRYPGQLLDAQLTRKGKRWIYRLKVLAKDGRVLHLQVDAKSGRVLKVKGK